MRVGFGSAWRSGRGGTVNGSRENSRPSICDLDAPLPLGWPKSGVVSDWSPL